MITEQEFVAPPEAPVFEPSEEEFTDPLAYIAKIRPIAEKTGICKIRPPPDWQPPFAVDVENFRFTPRVQRLNELEAKTRIKLNFLDSIAKFWELQGCRLKIPNVCGKCLDLYNLSKIVQDEGGFETVCRERKWSRVANRLHYPPGKGVGSQLLKHYERILWPFDVFHSGVPFDQPVQPLPEGDAKDKDYVPHGIPSRQAIKPSSTSGYSRRVKRQAPEEPLTVDISNNPELKKLQLFGPGPKFQGLGLVAQPGEKKGSDEIIPITKSAERNGTDGSWAKLDRQSSTSDPDYKEPKATKKATKTSPRKLAEQQAAGGSSMTMRARTGALSANFIEMYMCHTCGRGDAEDCLLLCDGCDDSFHTFCLIPPLPEVPKGDWRCPSCVAKECSKPQDPFGFETARREYTLQSFGEKADQFKKDFFSMPVHMVPPESIEKEFWRLVQSVEDDVLVEYGADIHTLNQGSGFPTKKNKCVAPEDQEYITSPWNLNNLPIQNESVLCHINADISGMKVPWIYVGMCFSSFCWHNEDHWSYSINYLHWGEPKTWYGVPGSQAEAFEEVMKNQAPELFEAQPDLLHQLVTIMSPTILMNHGVPIVRTNQCAGEFVVTFPRAYHAGFNQGYNFAEAVNFCPADWLPMGRLCIEHYRQLNRVCVFSHEELVCKMAADPESLDLSMAAAVYKEMLYMVEDEKGCRKALLERGTVEAEREAFELLPDDERQCESCKTTCFLSAITCPCTPNRLVCIKHVDKLCECQPSRHCLRYRYTLDELPAMLHNLKIRAESFDNWANKVKNALEAPQDSKLDMSQLKEMIEEADEKHFPDNDLLQQLMNAVAEAEQCASVAIQLVNKKHRTRSKSSTDSKFVTQLNYEELHQFLEQVQNLPCEISEAQLVQKLVDEVERFREDAQDALCDATPNSEKLRKLLEVGATLDVELPEIPKLKLELHQARWLDDVRATLALPNSVTLDTLRKLIDSGVSLAPHQAIEKAMAELQELLTVSERWEEKANVCLTAKPRHAISTVEAVVNEARNIPAHLPNMLHLKDALRKAKDWSKQMEEIQSGEHFPYLDVLECMVVRGRTIPIRLDQLAQVESQVAAARAWRDRAGRTFLKKNSSYTLLEVLSPRTDVGQYLSGKARRKKQKDMERMKEQEKEYATDVDVGSSSSTCRDPEVLVASYKNAEAEELDAVHTLRDKNRRKQQLEEEGMEQGKYCVCRKPVSGFMLQCELCKDWFHTTCVPLPKASSKTKFASGAGGGNVITSTGVNSIKDMKFLCPMCLRSRRPRLETILSLLVLLQKLPVRLPEGEALQRLTEHAMNWQDRAKQALATDELSDIFTRLSSMSQKMQEQAARVKTERIILAELEKAAKKPELQERMESMATMVADGSGGVHQDSILHGMPPVARQIERVKVEDVEEEEEHVDMDMGVAVGMDTSSAEDMMIDSPMAAPSAMDTGFASEHAYSAASKPQPSQPSKKHSRKTPHVPRIMDPPSPAPVQVPSTPGTLELPPLARAQLEALMVEGDLLEVTLDETQHIWRILQACQPLQQERFMEHILEQMPPEGLEKLKIKSETKEKKKMKLKRKREDMDIMSADIIKLEKKKKKKEKKEKESAGGSTSTTPQKKSLEKALVKKEGKENKQKQKKKLKKRKGEKLPSVGMSMSVGSKKKEEVKEEVIVNVDGDEEEDDEVCSAKRCLRPLGDDINWVQCDVCEKWYHLLCIGMKEQPDEDEEFICRICTKKRSMQKGGVKRTQPQTSGNSTTTSCATPVKQPEVKPDVKPATLTRPAAVQQQGSTKSITTSQVVAKVQSSGRTSGRNSPTSVTSGRSSPATPSTKSTAGGASGKNSPAVVAIGQKSSATSSIGRKSPLSFGTGRSSPITSSHATVTNGKKLTLLPCSGKKSPLTIGGKPPDGGSGGTTVVRVCPPANKEQVLVPSSASDRMAVESKSSDCVSLGETPSVARVSPPDTKEQVVQPSSDLEKKPNEEPVVTKSSMDDVDPSDLGGSASSVAKVEDKPVVVTQKTVAGDETTQSPPQKTTEASDCEIDKVSKDVESSLPEAVVSLSPTPLSKDSGMEQQTTSSSSDIADEATKPVMAESVTGSQPDVEQPNPAIAVSSVTVEETAEETQGAIPDQMDTTPTTGEGCPALTADESESKKAEEIIPQGVPDASTAMETETKTVQEAAPALEPAVTSASGVSAASEEMEVQPAPESVEVSSQELVTAPRDSGPPPASENSQLSKTDSDKPILAESQPEETGQPASLPNAVTPEEGQSSSVHQATLPTLVKEAETPDPKLPPESVQMTPELPPAAKPAEEETTSPAVSIPTHKVTSQLEETEEPMETSESQGADQMPEDTSKTAGGETSGITGKVSQETPSVEMEHDDSTAT
ncbi:lysine-specific demethylase 5A-like [Diadema antillarum]|uniref:lysine-specific demethylase 5A-like n=1 Tax=Diadema antillarum TaxID=105358 RepID=UPI003A8A54DF